MNETAHSPLTLRSLDEVIAWDGEEAIRLGQFLARASAIAAALPDQPFVFNLCGNPRNYLYSFYGAMLAGQCTLMPPNRLPATLDEIRAEYPDSYVLADCSVTDFDLGQVLRDLPDSNSQVASCPLIPEEQLCAIAFTSGSTGKPKPNLKRWRTLRCGSLNNAEMMFNDLPLPVTVLSTVPPQHMWGLETTILMPMFSRVAISGRSPFYPLEICEALQALPGPRVLVSTPVHLRALHDSGLTLPPIERILSATAPLPPRLARDLESRYRTTVLEIFGCSESGILASRLVTQTDAWSLAAAFQLDIVGGRPRITADHLPGDVHLQDVVEKLPGHRFRWLGRDQDLVNIAGKRASLADINRRLLEIRGVTDGVVFFPDDAHERLAALVVAPGLSPAEVLSALRGQLDPVFLPRPLLMVERLPRSENGKLQRGAVLELFAARRAARGGERCG